MSTPIRRTRSPCCARVAVASRRPPAGANVSYSITSSGDGEQRRWDAGKNVCDKPPIRWCRRLTVFEQPTTKDCGHFSTKAELFWLNSTILRLGAPAREETSIYGTRMQLDAEIGDQNA
jgi:hypothetical protein